MEIKKRAIYSAMVTNMDAAIGQVVDIYKKYDFWKDTVMVFSSDNGGKISTGASNYPLRGAKGLFLEGGIKTIGFVHSPLLPDHKKAYCSEITFANNFTRSLMTHNLWLINNELNSH